MALVLGDDIRRSDGRMVMDIFTKAGLKVLCVTFAISFLLGGVTAIIGFTMIVDLMAGR